MDTAVRHCPTDQVSVQSSSCDPRVALARKCVENARNISCYLVEYIDRFDSPEPARTSVGPAEHRIRGGRDIVGHDD